MYLRHLLQPDQDFNPRSREGSDDIPGIWTRYIQISIHAPARGATGCHPRVSYTSLFQSTLPRGERPSFPVIPHIVLKFQSTLPRGERQYAVRFDSESTIISIHAPARGATSTRYLLFSSSKFQSTLPRGERRYRGGCERRHQRFQSTLPRGERRTV